MCTHVEIVFKYIETNADKIIRKHEETYHWKIFETSLKKWLAHMIKYIYRI